MINYNLFLNYIKYLIDKLNKLIKIKNWAQSPYFKNFCILNIN